MRIGVTGGKGGTGKSTVATALAWQLGYTLLDADVDCPNDHLLLGINRVLLEKVTQRVPKWDMERCIGCGKCEEACASDAILMKEKPVFLEKQCNGCGACQLSCPHNAISWADKEIGRIYYSKKNGIRLLSGELRPNEQISELVVKSLLQHITKNSIVDTAAGIHCPVIAALEPCGIVLAVTEPTPLAEHDLRLCLELCRKMGKKVHIILNKADIADNKGIEDIASEYNVKIILRIPFSKVIIESYSKGIPVPLAIDQIAELL